jgi:hypothetical protein
MGLVDYRDICDAVEAVGMLARGGFVPDSESSAEQLTMPDGRRVRCVVVIGNIGGTMWPHFRAEEQPTRSPSGHPLDAWTRATLAPIAANCGAAFVHPSDEPFQPFQRWAQLADDVWASPIGMLVHHHYGLWHAYRGAFLFAEPVRGLPDVGAHVSPCSSCVDQPCLSACPVDAFTTSGYDSAACAVHVRTDRDPDCLHDGCAARHACPVGAELSYGPDQMEFHMRAFVGMPT